MDSWRRMREQKGTPGEPCAIMLTFNMGYAERPQRVKAAPVTMQFCVVAEHGLRGLFSLASLLHRGLSKLSRTIWISCDAPVADSNEPFADQSGS